ncbi:unnamed protein product [Sphagnum tenellum]
MHSNVSPSPPEKKCLQRQGKTPLQNPRPSSEQTKATTTKSSLPPAAATRTGSSAQFSDPNAAVAAAAAKRNEIDAEQIRVSTSRDLVRLGTTGSEGLGSAARLACCLQGGNMFDVPDRNAGHPRSRNRVRETSTS